MSGLSQTLLVPAALKIDDLHQQKRLWLSKLVVDNFRNYQRANLQIDAPSVVLIGPNGAGKTNLLEAISLFTRTWYETGTASTLAECEFADLTLVGRHNNSKLMARCKLAAVSC